MPLYKFYANSEPTKEDAFDDSPVSDDLEPNNAMNGPKFARLLRESGLLSTADDASQAVFFNYLLLFFSAMLRLSLVIYHCFLIISIGR